MELMATTDLDMVWVTEDLAVVMDWAAVTEISGEVMEIADLDWDVVMATDWDSVWDVDCLIPGLDIMEDAKPTFLLL